MIPRLAPAVPCCQIRLRHRRQRPAARVCVGVVARRLQAGPSGDGRGTVLSRACYAAFLIVVDL